VARRRRNSSRRLFVTLALLAAIGGTGYWYLSGDRTRQKALSEDYAHIPVTSDRPEASSLDGGPYADVPERGNSPEHTDNRPKLDAERQRALLAAGRRTMEQGQLVTARAQLSEALRYGLPLQETVQLRAELSKLAGQTILSNAILPDDPFVEAYVIQPGDALGKIAKRYRVTEDLLAQINGIADKNHIRAGQRIKVVQGPFYAVIRLADYTLDVYLHDTFIKSYPVGLGADRSTPPGTWVVQSKLKNPQYYPPHGGKIILADDPENPLGERWIGLKGIEGQALGQERYGIHGTIEPDSIGKSASLGCIRMHNPDVEELYNLLVVNHSKVTVK